MTAFQWLMAALGLAMMMEGAAYALFAPTLKKFLEEAPPSLLRKLGWVMIASGFVFIWLSSRLG